MGFDFTIGVSLALDPNDGLPFIWDGTGKKLPYNTTDYQLPDKYRRFAQMRGHHLHHYTRDFEEDTGQYHCSADAFLHYFPSWANLDTEELKTYEWNEADHNLFRECVAWCAEKRCYEFSWSW